MRRYFIFDKKKCRIYAAFGVSQTPNTNSWTKGESDLFSGQMLILNFCINGRCDASLAQNRYAIVRDAEAMIMQDLSKRITAKEMADRFGISESSFKLYVKGILGDSYLAYFRKKRMEKAAELLESTNLKAIEIANSVGYENQGKFAKVFAETYGVLPLEYRRLSK